MKKYIFFGIIILLLLPTIDKEIKVFTGKDLFGDFIPAKKPVFTFHGYFNGEFQSNTEAYLKDNIGFKNFFIRVYNQMLFSLYEKGNSSKGVVGKDQYLYLQSYIDNVSGENYVGQERIETVTDQIGFLQEYFQNQGKMFFTVILPSKASYYKEYIPERFAMHEHTNYDSYVQSFENSNINYIDLNKYFLSKKNDEEYPIFPKNGVHWTTHAMLCGLDTIFNYIETNSEFQLSNHLERGDIEVGISNDPADNDVEMFFNLFFDLPKDDVANIEILFPDSENMKKPRIMVIGDSYYYKVYNHKIPNHIFDWGGYWFYNKKSRRYKGDKEFVNKVVDLEPVDLLHEQDIIILWASHATLHLYPYTFEDYTATLVSKDTLAVKKYLVNKHSEGLFGLDSVQAYSSAQLSQEANAFINRFNLKSIFLRDKIEALKKSENDMINIRKKAGINGISDSAMLVLEAEWYYKQKLKREAQYAIPQNIQDIKSDPVKMKHLIAKAKEKGISVHEMVKHEAELQFINEHGESEDALLLKNIHAIKGNEKWYNSIKEKAEKNGLSLDKMIEKDAKWMLQRQKENQKNN
jgi:hypothetical protein